jgi:tRNA threonylcarbamoyl adenosine modification protein YeaZ
MVDLPGLGPRFGLALYTAGQDLGLGLSDFSTPARCQAWPLGRELSVYLHQYLGEFLPPQEWTDLKFIVVAAGPGSFTSTRLGMVTARTLSQQLEIPLFAVSTLLAAAGAISAPPESLIATEMSTHSQQQLYGAIYRFADPGSMPTPLLPDQLFTQEQWQQTLAGLDQPYQNVKADGDNPDTPALCGSLLKLAHQRWQQGDRPHWSTALPFYES